MDTFSEKELEQLKKLEQLRRLLQTILREHVRLLVAVFVIVLSAILLSVYLKAVYSPVRYEAQAMLYYYPKHTANIRPYDGKYQPIQKRKGHLLSPSSNSSQQECFLPQIGHILC